MSYVFNVERETIINFNESEKSAEVYTYNLGLKKQLALLLKSKSDVKLITPEDKFGCIIYEIPKKWIKIKPPCVLSDNQLEHVLSIGLKTRFK